MLQILAPGWPTLVRVASFSVIRENVDRMRSLRGISVHAFIEVKDGPGFQTVRSLQRNWTLDRTSCILG